MEAIEITKEFLSIKNAICIIGIITCFHMMYLHSKSITFQIFFQAMGWKYAFYKAKVDVILFTAIYGVVYSGLFITSLFI